MIKKRRYIKSGFATRIFWGILFVLLLSMFACGRKDEGYVKKTGSRWEANYTKYNSEDKKLYVIKDGNVIHFEVKTDKGSLTITVKESKGDDIYFQKVVSKNFSHDVTIPKNAEVVVTGNEFSGSFCIDSHANTTGMAEIRLTD